jgi:acyl carrier protein
VELGWIALGLGFLVATVLLVGEWRQKKSVVARLGTRPQLGSRGFGTTYFGGSPARAQVAAKVREVLARHLPFPVDGVLPGDRPVQDLMMDDLDSMATVEFVLDLEKQFGIEIPDQDAAGLRSLQDIVDYVDHRGVGGPK